MNAVEGIVSEEATKLFGALTTSESQMQVVQYYGALVAAVTNDGSSLEGAALLPPSDGQVDVVAVVKGKGRENGIPVSATLETMFVTEGDVRILESTFQLVDLSLETCRRPAVGNLLQERDGGVLLADEINDPLEPIAAIDATDSLMNVPSKDSQPHFRPSLPFAIPQSRRFGSGENAGGGRAACML